MTDFRRLTGVFVAAIGLFLSTPQAFAQQPDRGDVARPARVVKRRVSQIVPHVGIGPEPKQGCDEFRVRGRVTRDVQRGLVSGHRPVLGVHLLEHRQLQNTQPPTFPAPWQ